MTNGHPTREEDFDLYVLGALEGDEKQAIESHLAACADCTRKLAAARGRVAAISFAAPRVEPSAAVKDRLLRQVRAESQAPSAVPLKVPSDSAKVPTRGTGREFAPPEPPRGLAGRWLFAILAPACVALLIATVILWRENSRLEKQLADLGTSIDKAEKQLADEQEMLHLYTSKDTIKVALAPKPGMIKGDGEVMYNGKMGLLMYDGWIAPSPDDKSYQLWVVPMEGKPISAGVFNPATSDTAHWMAKVPEGIAPKMFAITLEPAGGMPQPTGPMVLVGGT
jgi:anti-sigma-K factor RskA